MTSQWVSSLTTTSKGMSLIHDGSYSDICQRLGSLLCNDGLLELTILEKNKIVALTFSTSTNSSSCCGDMYDLCHDLLTCPEVLSVICYTKIFDFIQHLILYGPTQSSLVNAKRLILPLFDITATHVRNYRTYNTALQQPTNLLHKVMGGRVDRGAPVRHASHAVYTLLSMDDASLIHKRDTLIPTTNGGVVTEDLRCHYLQQQIKQARLQIQKNQQRLHPSSNPTVGGYGSGTERVVGAAHSLEDMLQLASHNQQKKKHSYRDQPTQPTEQDLREQETIRKLQLEVQQQQQQQQQQPPPDVNDLFGFPTPPPTTITTTTTPTPSTTVVASSPQEDLLDFTSTPTTNTNTTTTGLDVPIQNTEVDLLGLQVESTTTTTTATNIDLLNWDTPTIPPTNDNEKTHSIFDMAPTTTTNDAVSTTKKEVEQPQTPILFDYLAPSNTTNNNSTVVQSTKEVEQTILDTNKPTVETNQVSKNIMNNTTTTNTLALDDLVASLSTIPTTNTNELSMSSPIDPPPLPPATMKPPPLPPATTMDPPPLPLPAMDPPPLPPPSMDPPPLPPTTMDLPMEIPDYDATTDDMDTPVMGGTINVAPIPSFSTEQQPQTPLSMQDMMEQLQQNGSNMSPQQMQTMMQSMMQMMMQQQQQMNNNQYP